MVFLKEELLAGAGLVQGCADGMAQLAAAGDKEEMLQCYWDRIDFCLAKNFPTKEYLKEHFDGMLHERGIYIDERVEIAGGNAVLLGACEAECGVEKYVFGSTFLYGHTKNPLSFFARLGRRHKIFVPQDLIFTHNNIVCPNTFLVKGGARRNIYINDRKYRHIRIIWGMPYEMVRGHAQSRAQIYKNNFTSTTA